MANVLRRCPSLGVGIGRAGVGGSKSGDGQVREDVRNHLKHLGKFARVERNARNFEILWNNH